MTDTLNCSKSEFMKMNTKNQMACLFENQAETLKQIKNYRFFQKVNMTLMALCFSALGYTLNILISKGV
jgi:hypothetical protein